MNTNKKSNNNFREPLRSFLWIVILIIIGVASFSSIRWMSPSLHMNTNFGASKDLSHAAILGMGILIVAMLSLSCRNIFTSLVKFRSNLASDFLLKIAVALLIAGMVISCFFAADKVLAFYSCGGLAIGLILMAVTYQLADSAWKIQLALIVVVTLGVTFASRAWARELWEFDESWQQYVQTREEFWAKQGKTLDDSTVKMFEARMLSRDNGGFFFHGNLGGMYLATVWLASLALVGRRWRDRRNKYGFAWLVTAGIMSGFILSALILTQSKGSILAAVIGLIFIITVWRCRRILRAHFRKAFIITCLLAMLAGGAVIGYGISKKTLPTLSMAYRWEYWVASYDMVKDHLLTGVGGGNFGHYYQRYKLPSAEEDISSPHNFIVQGFTQFGVIGGVGFLLLPAGIFYSIGRRWRDWNFTTEKFEKINSNQSGPSAALVMLGTWCGIFGVMFCFNAANQPHLIGQIAMNIFYMLIFPAAFVLGSIRGDQLEKIDSSDVGEFEIICLLGAGVAFVLGDLVNFSFEEPATQFLFFFSMGLALAAAKIKLKTQNADNENSKKLDWRLGIIFLIGIFVYFYYLMLPALTAERAAIVGENKASLGYEAGADRVLATYAKLAKRYSYDGHLAAMAGDRLLLIARNSHDPVGEINKAIDWFKLAADRVKEDGGFYSKIGQSQIMLAGIDQRNINKHFELAEEAFEKAWKLSPCSRSLSLTLGIVYADHLKMGNDLSDEKRNELRRKAIEKLLIARDLDALLPEKSLRHFSGQQAEQLRTTLERLQFEN